MSYFERRLNPYKRAILDLEELREDEIKGQRDYYSLADRLDRLALSEEADKLRSIAKDEEKHEHAVWSIRSKIISLIEE